MKAEPDPAVVAFLDNLPRAALFTSAVTQAEILYGIALLPEGNRRDALRIAAETMFERHFRRRVLPLERSADLNVREFRCRIITASLRHR
jgi:toxin FitB